MSLLCQPSDTYLHRIDMSVIVPLPVYLPPERPGHRAPETHHTNQTPRKPSRRRVFGARIPLAAEVDPGRPANFVAVGEPVDRRLTLPA